MKYSTMGPSGDPPHHEQTLYHGIVNYLQKAVCEVLITVNQQV